MKPVGWTAESMRVRCESCGEESTIGWELYFDALEYQRPVSCQHCGADQPMRDRRRREEPVDVDRRGD